MTNERKAKSSKRRTRSNRGSRRGGYVLVLVAFLLFGLMAMAALVIDIGFARLAQRQMQTATDAAALEGLRFRDIESDIQRRQRASAIVSNVFDDDLDATADIRNFGAGPIVQFDNGASDPSLEASQFMQIPDPSVYKPSLVSNFVQGQSDNSRGDMVAGNHDWDNPNPNYEPPIDSPGINEYRDLNSGEYVGRYFTIPNANAPDPKNAFVVRIRRTEEILDGNGGTSGPALPYLFGRGSLIKRQLIGEGIKVRATSIAAAKPVVCVGTADPSRSLLGGINVAVRFSTWQSLTFGVSLSAANYTVTTAKVIGDETVQSGVQPLVGTGYVALFENINSVDRIVGFGYGKIIIVDPMNLFKLQKLPLGTGTTQIAPQNASSVFCFPMSAPIEVVSQIMATQKARGQSGEILLAPVLVR